jgi:glycosyltransferase involved in cell wall biosynthesis/predicted phosphodiesterase
MKPRIAKITGTFGTEVENGVGRFLVGLHAWSRAQGYPLHVFSAGEHVSTYPEVQNVHALSFPIPGGYKAVRAYYPLEGRRKQLRRALKALNPDLIHISTPEALGATGLWAARRLNRPVVGIYHTDFPLFSYSLVRDAVLRAFQDQSIGDTLRNRLQAFYTSRTLGWERWILGLIMRRILRRNCADLANTVQQAADWVAEAAKTAVRTALTRFYSHFELVITRSEIYREQIIRELALPAERVRTLRAGVDVKTFAPDRTGADEGLRERLGLPAKAAVVLYVGRVTDEKNIGFLADAWRVYRNQHPNSAAVLLAVGSGNLEEFRRRAGPGVYTPGPLHGPILSAVYRLAELFWTASTTETLGQVVLEALASGVPPMVANQGAARENVQHGKTGLVVPTDDPTRWAVELHALLSEEGRLTAMRQSARAYAELHSIETSYRHYWELHEEVSDRQKSSGSRPTKGYLIPRVKTPADPASEQIRRTVHLSDFHAGKRSRRIPKEAALRAACCRIADCGAKTFLHGDFLDTRPPLAKFRSEIELVRQTFEEFGISPTIYVEGNHDYEFARAGQIENLLGCPVAPGLVHLDAETGLAITHGHVSELPGIEGIIRAARSREALVEALSIGQCDEALKVFAFRYDAVGVVADIVERAGLQDLEDAWRSSLEPRRWLADRLIETARYYALDDCGVKAVVHMIGSSDREYVLSQLCAALGTWGLVYGHTHEPHISKHQVKDPLSGKICTVLLGNCGSFRRKSLPPTWIETVFPHMELWAYNARTDRAELIDRATLRPDEAAAYQIHSSCNFNRSPFEQRSTLARNRSHK